MSESSSSKEMCFSSADSLDAPVHLPSLIAFANSFHHFQAEVAFQSGDVRRHDRQGHVDVGCECDNHDPTCFGDRVEDPIAAAHIAERTSCRMSATSRNGKVQQQEIPRSCVKTSVYEWD